MHLRRGVRRLPGIAEALGVACGLLRLQKGRPQGPPGLLTDPMPHSLRPTTVERRKRGWQLREGRECRGLACSAAA